MSASDWISSGAVIIALASLGWQVTTWTKNRRIRLRVSLDLVHYITLDLDKPKAAEDLIPSDDWELSLTILNDSDRPAHISITPIEVWKSEDEIVAWQPESWELPWKLDPRESRTVSINDDVAGGIDNGTRFRAKVRTSTGKVFISNTINVESSAPSHQYIAILEEQFEEIERLTGIRVFKYRVQEFKK